MKLHLHTDLDVGPITSREDVERLLLAMDAAALLAKGAHRAKHDPLADETNGRVVLGSIAARELRKSAAELMRTSDRR